MSVSDAPVPEYGFDENIYPNMLLSHSASLLNHSLIERIPWRTSNRDFT